MNLRLLALTGLTLAALSPSALADKDKDDKKDKPKAAVYKTPTECFDAYVKAAEKHDFPTLVGCLTPQARKNMASTTAFYAFLEREWAAGRLGDGKIQGEADEAAQKRLKPAFDVLDKHGLTEKATKDVPRQEPATKKAREELLKRMKDPEAFLVSTLKARREIEKEVLAGVMKAALADLKIDGDRATGQLVATITRAAKDKRKEQTQNIKTALTFEKIKGSWHLDPRPELKDEDVPKDKDTKDK